MAKTTHYKSQDFPEGREWVCSSCHTEYPEDVPQAWCDEVMVGGGICGGALTRVILRMEITEEVNDGDEAKEEEPAQGG